MEVQTRSEINGIKIFSTLKLALMEAGEDHTIWKISFPLATGERVRLVKIEGKFYLDQMEDHLPVK